MRGEIKWSSSQVPNLLTPHSEQNLEVSLKYGAPHSSQNLAGLVGWNLSKRNNWSVTIEDKKTTAYLIESLKEMILCRYMKQDISRHNWSKYKRLHASYPKLVSRHF